MFSFTVYFLALSSLANKSAVLRIRSVLDRNGSNIAGYTRSLKMFLFWKKFLKQLDTPSLGQILKEGPDPTGSELAMQSSFCQYHVTKLICLPYS